jgi:ferric-dicitrate binding protein FerR (iron transport regulator)
VAEQPTDDPLAGLIQIGIKAFRKGDRAGARSLFAALAKQHPHDIRLWLWLAGTTTNPDERRVAIGRAYDIDPEHPLVQKAVAALGMLPEPVPTEPPLEPRMATRRQVVLRWLWLLLALLLVAMLLTLLLG